ncbi:hypothetical protein IV38_GL000489 [Lactobacillus selangorensis]|uniref:Ribosomal protein eL8/eL30/eS12/Gadd45 domain-containing protein n=1 Tax=Lactobacillus selangorensis TaxID=81857 RepID=A0A0R2FLZ9_9LACO|nr:YlxQ-related RNA-binding protein [Lactobacillus selangorensis]KRN29603.1 hypothetical protein IV38_GL000489 [Lactobacillus selangorensis]KRN33867.1 hypothetical protein IV40_GL000179 [Lactobacillus selangorensis]
MITTKQRLLQLLGLAQRASKIVSGEPQVLTAIRTQSAKLVFVGSDSGQATAKKIRDKCHYYQIDITEALSKQELSMALGRKRTVIAVVDQGFAKKMAQLVNQMQTG